MAEVTAINAEQKRQEQLAGKRAARVNLLEERAKVLYGIWGHRIDVEMAWERLPVEHQMAWREVVEFIDQDPECACGQNLLCVDCNKAELRAWINEVDPTCGGCGKTLLCVECDADEIAELKAAAAEKASAGGGANA